MLSVWVYVSFKFLKQTDFHEIWHEHYATHRCITFETLRNTFESYSTNIKQFFKCTSWICATYLVMTTLLLIKYIINGNVLNYLCILSASSLIRLLVAAHFINTRLLMFKYFRRVLCDL